MRSAYIKDILRTIRGNLKRFVSIAVICALGVAMFCGLRAGCEDLRAAADGYFDEQNLSDVQVLSTLGLTDDDVAALAGVEGVEAACGGYSETTYTPVDGELASVEVRALSPEGMNDPYLVEGRLPGAAGEVAVSETFLEDSGLEVGDVVELEPADSEEDEVFARVPYEVVGVVIDAMDVNNPMLSFRSTSGTDYTFTVSPDAVTGDVYTVVYLRVEGAEELACYSDAYVGRVDRVVDVIEDDIREARERARTQEVVGEAQAELDEARADYEAERADVEAQLADAAEQLRAAAEEIASGQAEIDDGWAEVRSGEAELADGQREVDEGWDAYGELVAARGELEDGISQVDAGIAAIDAGVAEQVPGGDLDAAIEAIDQQVAQLVPGGDLDAAIEAIDQQVAQLVPGGDLDAAISSLEQAAGAIDAEHPDLAGELLALEARRDEEFPDGEPAQDDPSHATWAELSEQIGALAQLQSQRAELERQLGTLEGLRDSRSQLVQLRDTRSRLVELRDARAELSSTREGLASQLSTLEGALAGMPGTLSDAQAQVDAARARLADARAQLAAAQDELDLGIAEYEDGVAELESSRAEAEEGFAEAEAELADAQEEIDAIDEASWYVQERSSLASYSAIESDADSIEAIGTLFPAVFLVVAALVALTTVTRMVEEERPLIGTYKALGYRSGEIYVKYVAYALAACAAGSLLGVLIGYVALPLFLFSIFSIMYVLPSYPLIYDPAFAALGVMVFLVAIVGTAAVACHGEVRETPASLMRPKAPRSGSRILLERVGPVWRRLSFLNKVTARNLFRYKQRFLMTVGGILGCTALIVCGFVIRDSVARLVPEQYGLVSRYDVMAVTSEEDLADVVAGLGADERVSELEALRVDQVTLGYDGGEESLNLLVVADDADLSPYLTVADCETQEEVGLPEEGVVVTQNAAEVLGFDAGDGVTLRDATLDVAELEVTCVSRNFLGNYAFMTESAYERAFGKPCEDNAVLLNVADDAAGDADEVGDELSADGRMLSVTVTGVISGDFENSLAIINGVVVILIAMAAALAFAVLFALSTTNISERERELATIKVLGFRPREVHHYVNKETLILTGIGIVVGLPCGWLLGDVLLQSLKMPQISFLTTIEPVSWVISAVVPMLFCLAVNLITNRVLDRIDMIGALKSVE